MSTAVIDIRDTLSGEIRDAGSQPMGPGGPILGEPRFYRGLAPVDAANQVGNGGPGYFELVSPDEEPGGFYMQPGQEGHHRLRAWAGTEDDALRLYGWFRGLVHDVRLTVAGHQMIRGRVSLVQTLQDQDRKAWQAVIDYGYTTLDA